MAETFISPAGTFMDAATPAEAEDLRSKGWDVATPEAAAAHQKQVELGGLGGTAQAFGAGALRAGTLGASDYALSAMGAQEHLRNLREVNPGASMAGEVVGGVASLAVPIPGAGAGALARGASGVGRALGAGARLTTRAGEAAARGAGRLLGPGTAGTIGRWAAQGAVEGASFGLQQTLTEDALGERELTGEALLSSVGYGAATGGVFGGAIAGGGRMIKGGMDKIAAAKGGAIGEAFGSLYARATGAVGIEGASWLKKGAALTDEGADMRRVIMNGQAEAKEQAARFVKVAEEMESMLGPAERKFRGPQKAEHIRRHINRAFASDAVDQSRAVLGQLVDDLDDMVIQGGYARAGKIKKLRGSAGKALKDLADGGDAADYFIAIDQLKKDIAGEGIGRKLINAGPGDLTGAEKATRARLADLYESTRGVLERRQWWGNAAKVQEEVNSAWTKLIPEEADRGAMRALYKKTGKTLRGKDRVLNVDALAKALEDPTSAKGKAVLDAMRNRLEKGAGFMDVAGQHLDVRGSVEYAERLTEVKGLLDGMDHIRGVLDEFAAVGGGSSVGSNMLGMLGAGAVGAGAIDPGTAGTAGLLAAVILDPKRAVRQLAAVERIAGGTMQRMRKMSSKAVGKNLVRAGSRTDLAYSAWSARQRAKSEDAADAALTVDPAEAEHSALVRLGSLEVGAPSAVAAAARKVGLGAAYLRDTAPMSTVKTSAAQPLEFTPPDDELAVWDARRRAVDRPMSLLQDVSAGTMPRPEAVEAARAVYPELYQRQIVDPLLAEVRVAADAGHVLDYDTSAILSAVTGEAISPLDAPEIANVIGNALMAGQPKPQPPQKRGGDDGKAAADRSETEYQRVMS